MKEFFRKVGDVHKSPRFRRLLSGLSATFWLIYIWTFTAIYPIWYITDETPEGLGALSIVSLVMFLFWFFSWLVCCICAKVREFKEFSDMLKF